MAAPQTRGRRDSLWPGRSWASTIPPANGRGCETRSPYCNRSSASSRPAVLNRFGDTTNARAYTRGNPWYSHRISGKQRPESGGCPGFATHSQPAFPKRLSTHGRHSGLCTCDILVDMDCRPPISPAARDRNRPRRAQAKGFSLKGGLMCLLLLLAAAADWSLRATGGSVSAIRFELKPIAFQLEHGEVIARHVPATMAGGLAVFDYNRDGRPDIFFTNGANLATLKKDDPKYRNRLFRNDGNGVFTDVTESAGLAGSGFDSGVAVGDYDNDGYPDLFVAGVHHNTLYHNNGNGTFTDVTEKAGISNRPDPQYGPMWGITAVWVDVNNDGLLDLFVVNYLQWDYATEPLCEYKGVPDYCAPRSYKGLPNQLFLNKGNGRFEDVSEKWGIRAHVGKGMGVGMADYDLDGRPDLFGTNDGSYNFLFHNLGDKFEEVAFQKGVALTEDGNFISGMGLDFRDFNNDGYPDLVTVALEKQTFPLWKNTAGRGFQEVTTPSGMRALSMRMAGFGVGLYDFDNDGWKDLFVSRGDVLSQPLPGTVVEQHNTVFRNLGASSGASGHWEARTAVRRPGRRRPDRCGNHGARQARRNLDESEPRRGTLAGHRVGRNQEQPRRHRRQDSGYNEKRRPVQPHDHQRGLCVVELRAGAFRIGRGRDGGIGSHPMAVGNRADAAGRPRRPGAEREGDAVARCHPALPF